MRLFLLLSTLLLLAPAAQAASCLWTGASGNSWHTPTAWSCGRVPTSADDVMLSTFNNVPAVSSAIEAKSLELVSVTLVLRFGATVGFVRVQEGAALVVDAVPATFGSLFLALGPTGTPSSVGGTATITVTQAFGIALGTLGPGVGRIVLAPGSVSTINGALNGGRVINGYVLRNEGTLRWTDQSVTVGLDGRIENASGALFEVSAAAAITSPNGFGTGFLVNEPGGTVRKTGPSTSTIGGPQGVAFLNNGRLDVAEGVLQLGNAVATSGGTGRYEVAAGATLRFSRNSDGNPTPHTLAPASVVTGAGTVEVTGGIVVSQGTFTPALARVDGEGLWRIAAASTTAPGALTIAGGTVTGTGADAGGLVTVAGPFVWSGGRVGSSGTPGEIEVRSAGAAALAGGDRVLTSGTVTIAGTGTWTSGNVSGGGVLAVAPGGVLDMSAEAALVSPNGQGVGVLLNAGTVRKTGAGVTTVGGPQGFRLDNRGLVEVTAGILRLDGTYPGVIPQTAGALRLAGGSVDGSRPFGLDGGALEGSGSVANPVTIGSFGGTPATLAPGGAGALGTLTLGALTLNSGAVVDVEIGAAGASDRVAATGNVALTGTLRVRLAPGAVPAVGDRFAVVTCSGVCSGAFAALDLPPGLTGTVAVSAPKAEFVVSGIVAGEDTPGVPDALALGVAPNPARGAASVQITMPAAADIRVSVVDLLGREVAVLASGERPAGTHAISLDAARLAPGVYVVRLVTPAGALVRRLTITR